MDDKLQIIKNYLDSHKFCVISTINEANQSNSATMTFSNTDDLEIVFQTPNDTRKYKNLQKNPRVSIVVGWDPDEFITIQYEGDAREVIPEEVDKIRKIHIAKNPQSEKYAYLEANKYFIVKPKWIRYVDLKDESYTTFEINL